MNETIDDAEQWWRARVAERSEGERVQMACGMFSTAVRLAEAGILAESPGLEPGEVRVRLLRRLYGADLSEATLARIEAWLRAHWRG